MVNIILKGFLFGAGIALVMSLMSSYFSGYRSMLRSAE